jgi:outer membrane lipoprotein-sorting protein
MKAQEARKTMKMISTISIAAFFWAAFGLGAQVLPDAASLLAGADRALAPEDARFRMVLENFGGKRAATSEYECYSGGPDRFLMIFKAPAALVGQAQLKAGDTIYYYVRKVDKTIQTSAKAQFSNTLFTQEDVMSSQLSALYAPEIVEAKELEGRNAYIVSLAGKTDDVAYKRVKLYLDAASGLPFRREYFSFSGQLVKYLTIDKLERDARGRPLRLELTMTDALRKGSGTRAVLEFLEYGKVDPRFFTRPYLKVVTE